MRALGLLGVLAFGFCLGVPRAGAGEAVDRTQAHRLVAQLGASDFHEREEASRALAALGEPARVALIKATDSPDLEIRRRARELLPAIELRLIRERSLKPRRVRLRCKDLPVAGAVALLAKESRYPVVLYDPGNLVQGKKVTLDTGETTFWDALEQLCRAGGLIDWDPSQGGAGTLPGGPPGATPVPPTPGGAPGFPGGLPGGVPGGFGGIPGGGGAGMPGGWGGPPGMAPGFPGGAPGWGSTAVYGGVLGFGPGQTVLVPGKPTRVPTDIATSVRVRRGTFAPFGKAAPGIDRVVLQMTPEACLQWLHAVEVSVTEARDDLGQKRTPVPSTISFPIPAGGSTIPLGGGFPGGAMPGGWAMPAAPFGMGFPGMGADFNPYAPLTGPNADMAGGASHRYTHLDFKQEARPARSLAILRGTIRAWVQLENEDVLTFENPVAGKGKSVTGKYGVRVEVTEVQNGPDGRVSVNLRMELPAEVEPDQTVRSTAPAGAPAVPLGGPGGGFPLPPGLPPGLQGGGVMPGMAGPGGMAPTAVPAEGFRLVDDTGKVLPANVILLGHDGASLTTPLYQVQYVPPKGGADKPVRLVFRGRRTALVDIPFTLKEVPLR